MNTRFQFCLLLVALALASPARAIVNVEQAIIGKPAPGVHSTLDFLVNGASGNSEKSSSKAELLSLWQHGAHTEFLQLQYAYGKSWGVTDTDRAFAHLRHRTALDADWSGEAFAQLGRDPFARLTQRALLGGGLRRILFEHDKVSAAYLGIGLLREHETLSAKLGTSDATQSRLWRGNSYLVLKRQLGPQVRIYSTSYYQPALADAADYRVLEQASLLVKLDAHLDFKISLDIAFDSKPPQTVNKRDLFYSTGLEYTF